MLQVLSLPETSVVAAAKPTDDLEPLYTLQHRFERRLMLVEMELLDSSTVEESKIAGAPQCTPARQLHCSYPCLSLHVGCLPLSTEGVSTGH